MKNKVQVFGLPKSGTNFIEWSLNKYFDIDYVNVYKKCNVEGLDEYNKKVALKHSYPSLEYSDYCIIIFKNQQSCGIIVIRKEKINNFEKVYKNYISHADKLDKNNSIILYHREVYNDYKNTMEMISNKFNIELVAEDIKVPNKRLNKGGANTREANREFKL